MVDPAAYEASPALASATALIGEVKAAINDHIEATARSKQYDGAVAISTYVNSTVPAWAAEALAFVAWRDAVWIYAVGALDSVLGGHRAAPSVEEFLAELPAMEWPA
ncbi:MAG: hypothetical protein B7Z40_15350 [Bosea sp. 12-68-7]|nr:MAG: hypothetical protein B7Z40_15350 [Bosea sp. 12-68-7]OYX01133.1 MAG: hypothetical protein B7Z14_07095 [Bosea sp. 32-68-6]